MKLKLLLLLSLCIAVFTTNLYAGVEPSPFVSEINQLGAVVNGLNSCLDRVQKAIAVPPNPILPSPNLNGAVNRLEAIDGQVESLDNFIYNTINSVMGFEPTPFQPPGVIEALLTVKVASDAIVDTIENFIDFPPNPIVPEFETALLSVRRSASYLSENVDGYIELLSGEPRECESGVNPENCSEECQPYTDNAGVNYCCCIVTPN